MLTKENQRIQARRRREKNGPQKAGTFRYVVAFETPPHDHRQQEGGIRQTAEDERCMEKEGLADKESKGVCRGPKRAARAARNSKGRTSNGGVFFAYGKVGKVVHVGEWGPTTSENFGNVNTLARSRRGRNGVLMTGCSELRGPTWGITKLMGVELI